MICISVYMYIIVYTHIQSYAYDIHDTSLYMYHRIMFFPTCQVRVVRFYVSCLLLSSSPLLLLLLNRDPRCRTSTTTIHAQCSLPDLNHDHPRPVFPAGPQPRPSTPSVPCRTSTASIVFPAGPHVGRYGTKNVQKKVRKNVRQVYATSYFAGGKVWSNQFEQMTESPGWTETFPLLYLWSCLQRRLRQATSYSKLLQITWSDLMLDWCLRQSTSHRVSVVYHSYGGMVDMWHRNICWSIWALIYSIAGQRQDGHHHRRIQQEEVVWSVVSSCVFLFAWQVMAEGDQSASAAQARSLSGSKHIGQWLLSKVLDKWFAATTCSVMFLQTCLTGGVLTCLGMFVCLAQVVHWPVWSCLSKPVESLEFTSHGPLTCLYPVWQTDMHNDLPGETNDWDS